MNSEQLFACSQGVLQVLQRSALVPALQACLSGEGVEENAALFTELSQSSSRYLDMAAGYSESESVVASHAGLSDLQSPSFWFDLDTGSVSEKRRKRLRCLKLVLQGQSFLSHIGTLVQDQADPVDIRDTAGDIKIRIVDATDRASDPDRISRLIDGVDLIYRACARLAGTDENNLKVMRLGGSWGRTVVFNGDAEPATATRRIVRAANDLASNSMQTEDYSVEEIADNNPFLLALDDLFRVGAVNADDAEDIRQGVLGGSIMLLECGARLYGVDASGDPMEFRSAKKSASAKSANQPPSHSANNDVEKDEADDLEYLILDLKEKYLK